ncbi:MAG: enolase C-terminal domain-like protein [Stackebrandtia sp.]
MDDDRTNPPLTVSVDVAEHTLRQEFRVSHATTSVVHLLTLTVRDRHGREHGRGEISADRGFGQDGPSIAREAAELSRLLLAENDIERADVLDALLDRHAEDVSGPARMLVEMALLDRAARLANRAVWQLLGLPDPGRVQLLHTVPIGQDATVADRPLKVKLGSQDDERVLGGLLGSPGPILLDVNTGWDRAARDRLADLVARLAPDVLEDPTDDPELLQDIRSALPHTRVMLDESVHTATDVLRAANLADGANVKVMRMGGLLPAVRSLNLLRDRGLTRMVGCFLEPERSVAYAAQLRGIADWTDLDGHFWITGDPPVSHYQLDSSRPGVPVISYDIAGHDVAR